MKSQAARNKKIDRAEAMIQKGLDSLRAILDDEKTRSDDNALFRIRMQFAMVSDRFKDLRIDLNDLRGRK